MNPGRRNQPALVILAAIALSIAVVVIVTYQRRQGYLIMAEHHLAQMAALDQSARSDGHLADMVEGKAPKEMVLAFMNPIGDTRKLRSDEDLKSRRAAYHSALSLKYREAAARPWAAVEPDPPSP